MRRAFVVILVLTSVVADVRGAVTSLRLVLPMEVDPVIENIANVFKRQIQSRCNAQVNTKGDAPLAVEFAVEPGIGTEGFKISDGRNGSVRIIGNDNRGLLYGVGKYLHTSTRQRRLHLRELCPLGIERLPATRGSRGKSLPKRFPKREGDFINLVLRSLGHWRMGWNHRQVQCEETRLGGPRHGRQFRGISSLSVGDYSSFGRRSIGNCI
jgi:hypothetical protein